MGKFIGRIWRALTPGGWWKPCIIEAVAGLIVALAAAIIVYSSPIQAAGSDLSQRLLVQLRDGGALDQPTHSKLARRLPSAWVFVDIGPRFCGGETGKPHCPPYRKTTNRAALAALVRAVRAQSPRVVILDVVTPAAETAKDSNGRTTDDKDQQADQALRRVLQEPGSPVLLALTPSPDNIAWSPHRPSQLIVSDADVLFPPEALKALTTARYLPALKRLDDGAARRLDPEAKVVRGNTFRIEPGIALGAAMVAEASPDDPFASIRNFTDAGGAQDATCAPKAPCAYRQTGRVFSFPPVSGADAEPVAATSVPFLHLTPDASGGPLSGALKDSVVVIGDARYSAGDLAWSAIRNVGGAELILNDVRQYLLSKPIPEPRTPWAHLKEELPYFLVGALGLAMATLLLGPMSAWAGRFHGRRLARDLAATGLTIPVNALLFLLLLTVGHEELGPPPDFVTPFVSLLLESLIAVAYALGDLVKGALGDLLGAPAHNAEAAE